MQAEITEVLNKLGVSETTQARLSLFNDVPPPEGDDAWTDPSPTVAHLSVGQINVLRSMVRSDIQELINASAQALAVAQMTGNTDELMERVHQDVSECGHDHRPDTQFRELMDLEDALTSAWVDSQPIESAPDTLPDDFETWDA